jgi:hypothetical protein
MKNIYSLLLLSTLTLFVSGCSNQEDTVKNTLASPEGVKATESLIVEAYSKGSRLSGLLVQVRPKATTLITVGDETTATLSITIWCSNKDYRNGKAEVVVTSLEDGILNLSTGTNYTLLNWVNNNC